MVLCQWGLDDARLGLAFAQHRLDALTSSLQKQLDSQPSWFTSALPPLSAATVTPNELEEAAQEIQEHAGFCFEWEHIEHLHAARSLMWRIEDAKHNIAVKKAGISVMKRMLDAPDRHFLRGPGGRHLDKLRYAQLFEKMSQRRGPGAGLNASRLTAEERVEAALMGISGTAFEHRPRRQRSCAAGRKGRRPLGRRLAAHDSCCARAIAG